VDNPSGVAVGLSNIEARPQVVKPGARGHPLQLLGQAEVKR
jgi:hypothetical protein